VDWDSRKFKTVLMEEQSPTTQASGVVKIGKLIAVAPAPGTTDPQP
jgi:hypothetical protein